MRENPDSVGCFEFVPAVSGLLPSPEGDSFHRSTSSNPPFQRSLQEPERAGKKQGDFEQGVDGGAILFKISET